MTTPLEALARRVETEEPSRELDGDIALTQGWTFKKMKGDAYWRRPDQAEYYQRSEQGPPQYTSSLDAAVSLMSEEHHVICVEEFSRSWVVKLGHRENGNVPVIWGEAPTEAQARTSAALRAIDAKGKM